MCVHWEYREGMCFCIENNSVQRKNVFWAKQEVQIFQCLRLLSETFTKGVPARSSPWNPVLEAVLVSHRRVMYIHLHSQLYPIFQTPGILSIPIRDISRLLLSATK